MMWLLWAVVRMAPQKDPGDGADLEAVRRMAAGDGQALALLYDRHSRVTFSLALRILAEPLEAEEVVQDVFAQG
jgi:RNA polymerase sigma-70 factor, ECF subfamily